MSISRAQLAAALVEYDNDDAAPAERKNHRQSALFSHLQPKSPSPPRLPSLPHHVPLRDDDRAHSHHPRTSTSSGHREHGGDITRDHRQSFQSRRSAEIAQPLGPAVEEDDIDVSRWGLPEHLISTNAARSPELIRPMMASRASIPSIATKSASTPVPNPESSPFQQRARSIHLDYPDDSDIPSRVDPRRRTISFELDRNADSSRRRTYSSSEYLSGADAALAAAERALALADMPRARSVMGALDADMAQYGESSRIREPMMIPLPDSPTSMYTRPISSMSRGRSFEIDRSQSYIGEMYGEAAEEEEEVSTPNPFALPAPPPTQASRFDPKVAESAARSPTSPLNPSSQHRQNSAASLMDPRRSSQIRPSSSRLSAIQPLPISPNFIDDPSRPTYTDIPTPGEFGRPLIPPKYARRQPHPDRRSLLRPRTLIMPVPLLGADYVPEEKVRAGFTLGEKPLPPGARSSILSMGGAGGGAWQPRSGVLPGQVGEVQQQGREFGRGLAQELQHEEEEDRRRREEEAEARTRAESRKRDKMPGKLYGTSLMDQLEARKQYTKNKQRVFTGDSRPTMFARQSTLLPGSASSASVSPNPPHLSPPQPLVSPTNQVHIHLRSPTSPDKTRRQSARAPLLQFDDNDPSVPSAEADTARPGMPRSRSVFGVDELWEKEMAKLRIIQAEEAERKAAAEERERELGEREKKKRGWLGGKDKKGKSKGKEREVYAEQPQLGVSPEEKTGGLLVSGDEGGGGSYGGISPIKNRVGDLPPTLRYSPEKAGVPAPLPDVPLGRRPASRAGLDGWASEDEDEVESRRRAKGKGKAPPAPPEPKPLSESDSEDDMPLSRIIPPTSRSTYLIHPTSTPDSDSDEDVPLSRLAPRIPSSTHDAATIQLNSDLNGSLGLSVPALPPSISPRPPTVSPGQETPQLPISVASPGDDDDDLPLGLRPGLSTKYNLHALNGPSERTEAEKAEIEDDLPLGFKHANAAQRQVSGGSFGGNIAAAVGQEYSPYPQQGGLGWGLPQMGSMYGMMGYQPGYPQAPMYGGGYGGIPPQLPISTSGLPFLPQAGYMASPSMPFLGAPPAAHGLIGLGPSPGPGPGQNIDSWRKGVRAPSTVGAEGAR